MRLVEGSLSSLWPPLLGYLFAWTLVLAPCFFLSAFFWLSLAGFHHHFGQVQEDLSALNLGMKYAEQNVKHPPYEHWGCQCHLLLHHTHMVLHPHGSAAGLGSAYVSSNFKSIWREFEARFEPVWGSCLCFREPPGWSVFLHRLRLMLVFKYGVSWVSRFQCFFW
jgi:hypothetical protein